MARLVAKGLPKQVGVDYFEIFSPVVKPTTIRTILSITITEGWSLHQLDINNVFLHGDLQEQVYMTQPIGFFNPYFPNHVCRLNKAVYGLKQALRAWFSKLNNRLLELCFNPSLSDSSLFIYKNKFITYFSLSIWMISFSLVSILGLFHLFFPHSTYPFL